MPWLVLGWTAPAFGRGSSAGLGMPQYGGAFAGAGEAGVRGLAFNPASAGINGLEAGIEWSQFFARYEAQLSGESPEGGGASQGAPFAAAIASVPGVDGLGLGVSFGAPFARAAGEIAETSSQRFHGLSGQVRVLEVGISTGFEVVNGVQVGAGVSLQRLDADSRYALDSGAVLVELFGDDMSTLIGDPLLEGEVDITKVQGRGTGGVFGVRVTAVQPWTFAASVRTLCRIPVTGEVDLVPSNAFTLNLESGVEGEILTPPEVQLMVGRDAGPVRMAVEGHWIGWKQASVMEFEMVSPTLGSRDPAMEAILNGYGLTDLGQMIETQTDRVLGYDNSLGLGLRVDRDGERAFWMARSMYTQRATPDQWVHPANVDFAVLDSRIGAGIHTRAGIDIALSAGWYFTPPRTITTSTASLTAEPDEGPAYPSGNGTYALKLGSVGLSVAARLP